MSTCFIFVCVCPLFPLVVLERCYPKEVQELYDAMRRFARVVGPMEHDKFIESHACKSENCFLVSVYLLLVV